jgi:hypothetical protein
MNTKNAGVALTLTLLPFALYAQQRLEDAVPLKNWTAPLYWQPNHAEANTNSYRASAAIAAPNTASPTGGSALVFVAMTPCRVADTRASTGFPSGLGAPSLSANTPRTFPIQSSSCSVPSLVKAYSLNVTVVPPGALGFLTLYPTGAALPNTSTLNDSTGLIIANAAIVPAGTSGSVDAFANAATNVIIDINGYYAPPTDTNSNTSVGQGALGSNSTGSNNTASGTAALSANSSGSYNTGIGDQALEQNTTGSNNAAVGTDALFSNKDGSNNAAFGYFALSANTSGTQNTGLGDQALMQNVLVNFNTAVGTDALFANVNASNNTALGTGSMESNTAGSQNTAGGSGSLASNKGGSSNTAFGYTSLGANITGGTNVAVGVNALGVNTSSNGNVAIGYYAGSNIEFSSNIMIGNSGTSSDFRAIRIGKDQGSAFISVIRGVTTGATGAVAVLIDANGQLGTISSSERFKEDIQGVGGRFQRP